MTLQQFRELVYCYLKEKPRNKIKMWHLWRKVINIINLNSKIFLLYQFSKNCRFPFMEIGNNGSLQKVRINFGIEERIFTIWLINLGLCWKETQQRKTFCLIIQWSWLLILIFNLEEGRWIHQPICSVSNNKDKDTSLKNAWNNHGISKL